MPGPGSRARCEWGLAGLLALREQVAVLVVVDVLSFSTAVDVAVGRGAAVLPFPSGDPAAVRAEAARQGAVPAVRRGQPGFSLSPASLAAAPPGLRLLLPSPNGSRLSLAGGGLPLLAGCLRNAAAVASAALHLAGGGPVGVVPAGEHWPDGALRPAIEDLLGAGAILCHLGLEPCPEARAARDAYRAAGQDVAALTRAGRSGQELTGRGFSGDVDLAVQDGCSTAVPLLQDGAFQNYPSRTTASPTETSPADTTRAVIPPRPRTAL